MNPIHTVLSIPCLVINIAEQCPDIITLSRLSRCNKDFHNWIKVDEYLNKYKQVATHIDDNHTYIFEYIQCNKQLLHGNYKHIISRNGGEMQTTSVAHYKGKKTGISKCYNSERNTIYSISEYIGNNTKLTTIYNDEHDENYGCYGIYVKEQYTIVNDNLHDKHYKFSPSGSILNETNYINGREVGPYKESKDIRNNYVLNRLVSEYGTYVNGWKHGPFKAFIDDKILYIEGTYRYGSYHGLYQQWSHNTLDIERYYYNGYKHGISKRWWRDSTNTRRLHISFYNNGEKRAPNILDHITLLLSDIDLSDKRYSEKPTRRRVMSIE